MRKWIESSVDWRNNNKVLLSLHALPHHSKSHLTKIWIAPFCQPPSRPTSQQNVKMCVKKLFTITDGGEIVSTYLSTKETLVTEMEEIFLMSVFKMLPEKRTMMVAGWLLVNKGNSFRWSIRKVSCPVLSLPFLLLCCQIVGKRVH